MTIRLRTKNTFVMDVCPNHTPHLCFDKCVITLCEQSHLYGNVLISFLLL